MIIYSITVFYNTLKHNRIILYHIWYLLHDEPTVLYIFQNTPSIVSACCIEFNHYKMRIYSITVFYNTLKHNRIILYHIWYLLHDEPTVLYIFQNTPSIVSACCIEFNHYKMRITLLQYSTTLASIIASFCIIFDNCYMMNQQYYIYSRILPVLISTCCIEFNHYKMRIYSILQYFTTLSSIIASFCIIFDICYIMNQQYYIYSRILQVFISTCCIEFNE